GSDHFYWSVDPLGTTRLSQDECDFLGIPRLTFEFVLGASFWQEYHYSAIRSLSLAKGFDPYSTDVTRLLGLPLIEM
ncbi:hypothetical protein FB451DRAFT_988636, partial [Mycena latifolia]